MKRTLSWTWPILLIALALLVPHLVWRARPDRPIEIAVLDKTVPFRTWIEHRSLFWLLGHLKVVKADGGPYDPTRDYFGAHPPAVAGDKPERTVDLPAEAAARADLVYLADTYGVYRDDLASGPEMVAALERSPRIYGGLSHDEAKIAAAVPASGRTLVAEFNTLGSPTEDEPRSDLEGALGVRWTRWIGRYFPHLEDVDEVPAWVRHDYTREWNLPWEFSGPGYVLLQDDAHCEVLRAGPETAGIGLRIEKASPEDALLAGSADGVPYPYWFDIVSAGAGTEVLATFRWNLTERGRARLSARGLPSRFPAVTRRADPSGGAAYYFAGDFADNPMDDAAVPFAGYRSIRRWTESLKLAPSETAFFWSFYSPLMDRLLGEVERRRR